MADMIEVIDEPGSGGGRGPIALWHAPGEGQAVHVDRALVEGVIVPSDAHLARYFLVRPW